MNLGTMLKMKLPQAQCSVFTSHNSVFTEGAGEHVITERSGRSGSGVV